MYTSFNDIWATGQQATEYDFMYQWGAALPEEVFLPIYKPVNLGDNEQVCFNGGVDSGTEIRPGTGHYLRFSATQDAVIKISASITIDTKGNEHTYYLNPYYKGVKLLEGIGVIGTTSFSVTAGKEYVIQVAGERYMNSFDFDVNDTLCTTVSITQQ